LDEKYVYFEK
jgi:Ataxin-3